MCVFACRVTSDLCGLRPVAVIHVGAGWRRGGRVVTIWINMSAMHSCSPSSSLLLWLPLVPPFLSQLVLPTPASKPAPHLNSLFIVTHSPPSHFLSFLSFIKSCSRCVDHFPCFFTSSPPFTHHSSLLAPFPRFLPHDHSPFGKFIYLILNQRLHHHVALFLTLFFLTETASLLFPFSPPLAFSRRRESIPVHSQSVTAALWQKDIFYFLLLSLSSLSLSSGL